MVGNCTNVIYHLWLWPDFFINCSELISTNELKFNAGCAVQDWWIYQSWIFDERKRRNLPSADILLLQVIMLKQMGGALLWHSPSLSIDMQWLLLLLRYEALKCKIRNIDQLVVLHYWKTDFQILLWKKRKGKKLCFM